MTRAERMIDFAKAHGHDATAIDETTIILATDIGRNGEWTTEFEAVDTFTRLRLLLGY